MEIVLVLVLIGLIETLLQARWTPFYFRYGIPVLIKSKKIMQVREIPAPAKLRTHSERDHYRAFVFHRLDRNTYAFRESFRGDEGGFYTPVMRGLLVFDPTAGRVRLIGHANYCIFAIAAVSLTLVFKWAGLDALTLITFGGFVGAILGFIYLVQRSRFVAALEYAASMCRWRS